MTLQYIQHIPTLDSAWDGVSHEMAHMLNMTDLQVLEPKNSEGMHGIRNNRKPSSHPKAGVFAQGERNVRSQGTEVFGSVTSVSREARSPLWRIRGFLDP